MKNQSSLRGIRNGLGVGLSAASLALGCSSQADHKTPTDQQTPAPAVDQPLPHRLTCAEDPTLPSCAASPAQPLAPEGSGGPSAAVPAGETAAPPPVADCPDQQQGFDAVYAAVARDVTKLDATEARRTRYISLANRVTAGVCVDGALEPERQALFELVNMLSTRATITQPVALDAQRTLFRIDLGDYGWDEPVTLVNADGTTKAFIDKWEAIADNDAYAISFVGSDADRAVLATNTTVPVMLADTFLQAASVGNLYYALIGVDVQKPLGDFILDVLQIDLAQNLIDQRQVRAGTRDSRVSRQDRMIERDDITFRQGELWQAFDFEDVANQNVFDDPFGFTPGGTEAIFTLPNGLLGYVIADAAGKIVQDSGILLDSSQDNGRALSSVSCAGCHARGLLPVVDQVRETALANAIANGLSAVEREELASVFVDPSAFAGIAQQDSASFVQALSSAGVSPTATDPVSNVFLRFDEDVRLRDAAGDLGLAPGQLQLSLTLIDPKLQVLRGGSVDRDDFTQLYLSSLCSLSTINENQPDPIVCAEAQVLAE